MLTTISRLNGCFFQLFISITVPEGNLQLVQIWTKVVACIGCLWRTDGEIIGCKVEQVNGQYSEDVLVNRAQIARKAVR